MGDNAEPALNREAFAATAFILYIWVFKLKPFVQAFFTVIKLGAVNINEAFWINDYFDALGFKYLIIRIRIVGKLKNIGQAGASSRFDAKTKTNAFAALL